MNTYARNGFMWNNIIILRPLAWPNLVNPTSSAKMIVLNSSRWEIIILINKNKFFNKLNFI